MDYLMKFLIFLTKVLGHLFLLSICFLISHGFEFIKIIIEGPHTIGAIEYYQHISVPIALFFLAELLMIINRRSLNIIKKFDDKVDDLSVNNISKKIVDKISFEIDTLGGVSENINNILQDEIKRINYLADKFDSNINEELSKLKPLVSRAIYNSYLREPNHLVDGFSETIRHFLQPHSGELVEPISDFMKGSIESILENGFVKVNADFDDYKVASNNMVESIYDSPKTNSIKMISVYSPLQYLHMNTVGKKINIEKGKPNHLLVFNGYRVNNQDNDEEKVIVEQIKERTRDSTKRKRIIFLNKKDLIKLLKDTNDKAKASFMFSYLWFLTMNTEIKLGWGWKEEFREYWYDKKTTENGDVDFMIFNQKYFWRYNLVKKSLYISWDPLVEEIEAVEPTNQRILFGKSVAYFNKAKRIFNLPVMAEKKSPYSQDYSLAPTLPALFKKDGDIFPEFKNALKISIEMIKNNQEEFYNLEKYDTDNIKFNIFIERINSFLENNSNILDSALDNFEGGVIESFKSLKKTDLITLYSYYFHPSFADGVNKIFPNVSNPAEIF